MNNNSLIFLKNKLIRKLNIYLFDRRVLRGVKLPVKHILLVNWNGRIGDAIVSSSFLKAINSVGNIKVSVVTTRSLKSLYTDYYGVSNVYTVHRKNMLIQLWRISRELKDVDTIIPLMGYLNFKDLFFIYLLNPNNLFGLDDELGRANIQMGSKVDGLYIHEIFSYILTKLGIHQRSKDYIVPVKINNKIKRYDIVFNSFASRLDKSFSIGKSVDILQLIAKKYPLYKIGVLSCPQRYQIATEIVSITNRSSVELVEGINTYYDAIDAINKSNIVISIDTSLVHAASGLNKKLVSVYYQPGEQFNRWVPKESTNTEVIFSKGPADYDVKNMNNFNTKNVFFAINRLLNNEKYKNGRNIFLYWNTSEETIPLIHKMNIDNIRNRLNKTGWNIIVTSLIEESKNYIENYIELPDYFFDIKNKIDDFRSINGNQSDIIRLRLLEKFGGVYFDTSTILLKDSIDEIDLFQNLLKSSKATLAGYTNVTFTRKNSDGSNYFINAKDGMELGILYAKKNSNILKIFNDEIDKYWTWKTKDNFYKEYQPFKDLMLTNVSFLNEYHIHYSIFHMILTRDCTLLSELITQSSHMAGKENSFVDGPYSVSDRFCRGSSGYEPAEPKYLLHAFIDGDLNMYNGINTTLSYRKKIFSNCDLISIPSYMRVEIEQYFNTQADYNQLVSAYHDFYKLDHKS